MKTLCFKTLDGRSFSGTVKNPGASVGAVASHLARKAGLTNCELIDAKTNLTIDPETRLTDLPEEILMSPALTPA